MFWEAILKLCLVKKLLNFYFGGKILKLYRDIKLNVYKKKYW